MHASHPWLYELANTCVPVSEFLIISEHADEIYAHDQSKHNIHITFKAVLYLPNPLLHTGDHVMSYTIGSGDSTVVRAPDS